MRLAQLASGEVPGGLLVVDEAWSLVLDEVSRGLLVRALKLARAYGTSVVAITHRVGDVATEFDLLGDVGTVVAFGQSGAAAAELVTALHLDGRLAEVLTGLERGVALWLFGGHACVVRHLVAEDERDLVDTDAAMRAEADR